MEDSAMNDQTPVTRRDLVEQNINKVFPQPSQVGISASTGGLMFQTLAEIIEAAKMMSMSGPAIPPWLQGNPGGCWAIIVQANQWGFDPISVARMSYDAGGQVAYMAQLVHAVIERRAPLQKRLRFTYEGEGENRVCICTGHIKGEVDPLEYRSPPIKKISPKKSPLWLTDPDQQLAYYSSRSWCRRYCPDVLLGVYDREELGDRTGADKAIDVTDKANALHERLVAAAETNGDKPAEGFRAGIVEAGLNGDHDPTTGEVLTPTEPQDALKDQAATEVPAEHKKRRGRPPKAPPTPTNFEEYRAHVLRWLPEYHSEESIEGRWRAERAMRNQCGVIEDERKAVQILKDQRIQEVKK
jgi:hypothetical protein